MSMMFCMENRTLEDDVEFNPHTLAGRLKEVWTAHADREAIVFYDDNNVRTSITNVKLMNLCERFSSLVRYHGIKKGDVVCNLLSPGIEKEVANFGLILAGIVVMDGMDIDDNTGLFWEPINQAKVRGIIVEPDHDAVGWKILKYDVGGSDVFVESYTGRESEFLKKIFLFKVATREEKGPRPSSLRPALELLAEHDGRWVETTYGHDPSCIFVERCPYQKHYKLVLRTHNEMILMAERNVEMLRFVDSDIIYNDWPLSWVTGMPFSYFIKGCTVVKSTLIECEANKVVRETWDLLVREKCTMASLQPPMIQMLASHCEDLPEPHWQLRAVTTTYQVKDTVLDAIGVLTSSVVVCYSLIEAGLISCLVVDEKNRSQYRNGCVGRMHGTVRTQFDLDAPKTPKPSKVGEIFLHGNLISRGYYNDDNLTSCSFTKDGALITGDLGYYDENDQMYLLGRKGDAIIRRQTAIFPSEVEERVNHCPGIWKVKVVAVRDVNGVQQVCACVVPRKKDSLTIDRVKEYCRYQLGGIDDKDEDPHMPTYVFFFDSFPVLNGQVNRNLLTQMASDIVNRRALDITTYHDARGGNRAMPQAE